MARALRPLLLLHADPDFRSRVQRAASRARDVRPLSDWDELREAVRSAGPGVAVLADPYVAAADGPAIELRGLIADFPSVPFLAAHAFTADHYEDLRMLGQWGVAELVVVGREDTRVALRQRIRAAERRAVRRVLAGLSDVDLPRSARRIVRAAAEVSTTAGLAPDLAGALETGERNLLRRCARNRLPPPRRLLAWLRVLYACHLLDDPGRTVASVSQACGYAADMTLRRAVRNLVDADLRDLRKSGGLDRASAAFAAELAERQAEEAPASSSRKAALSIA